MDITRAGSQPSAKGPGNWFSGTFRLRRTPRSSRKSPWMNGGEKGYEPDIVRNAETLYKKPGYTV